MKDNTYMKDNVYFMTIAEACQELNLQRYDIYNLRSSGAIHAIYINSESKVLRSQIKEIGNKIDERDKEIKKFKAKHEEIVSCSQASALLGITVQAIRRMCANDQLECVEYRGVWCIAKKSVKKYKVKDTFAKHQLQKFKNSNGELMTVSEAGRMLNIPASHVKKWIKQSNINGCYYRSKWYVPMQDITSMKLSGIFPESKGRIVY